MSHEMTSNPPMTNPMLAELDALELLANVWDAKAARARDDAEFAKACALEDCADDLREKAHTLADMAKRLEAAERELDFRRRELAFERARRKRLVERLTRIHALLYPERIEVDGKVFVFQPSGLGVDPNQWMQELSDRIRAIPAAIDATQEGEG